MTLHGVDPWTSVSYFSVVLGPSPLVLDHIVCVTYREREEGHSRETQTIWASCSVQKVMRICLRRGRVNPCAENLLRCPHRAARKGNKMPLYSGPHVPRSQSVYYFRVLRPESASMLPQKHLQNGMLGKKKNCQR